MNIFIGKATVFLISCFLNPPTLYFDSSFMEEIKNKALIIFLKAFTDEIFDYQTKEVLNNYMVVYGSKRCPGSTVLRNSF